MAARPAGYETQYRIVLAERTGMEPTAPARSIRAERWTPQGVTQRELYVRSPLGAVITQDGQSVFVREEVNDRGKTKIVHTPVDVSRTFGGSNRDRKYTDYFFTSPPKR